MQRRALIADGAAGSPEAVAGVLSRFGFARSVDVATRDEAVSQMREGHFDLIIVPVEGISPTEMIALEREIRKDPTTAVIATAPSPDAFAAAADAVAFLSPDRYLVADEGDDNRLALVVLYGELMHKTRHLTKREVPGL